VEGVTLIGSD